MFADPNAITYPAGYVPPVLKNTEDLGLPKGMLDGIVLKRLYSSGATPVSELVAALKVHRTIIAQAINVLLEDNLIAAIDNLGGAGDANVYGVKPKGKSVVEEENKRNSYASVIPVSLREYTAMVECQRLRSPISMEILEDAFSDLVVESDLLKALGPAMINEGACFFYGPPGTGKTSIAERMIKIYKDDIFLPYAILAEGEIVTVFDPAIHVMAEQPLGIDRRWVLCKRPAVIVGGELSAANLELQRDEVSGIYKAPIQVLANNGLLVVDDFGRQMITPAELLNRWIVPLSRGIDFLALANGVKFQTPFDAKVVFSTNLDPSSLGDEAFFRRIPNKIYIGKITAEAFDEILFIIAGIKKVEIDQSVADALKDLLIERGSGGDLRPYFPMDFMKIFIAISEFADASKDENYKPERTLDNRLRMTLSSLDSIADIYFAQDLGGEGWSTAANDAN